MAKIDMLQNLQNPVGSVVRIIDSEPKLRDVFKTDLLTEDMTNMPGAVVQRFHHNTRILFVARAGEKHLGVLKVLAGTDFRDTGSLQARIPHFVQQNLADFLFQERIDLVDSIRRFCTH